MLEYANLPILVEGHDSVHQAGGSESRGERGLCSTGGGILPGEGLSPGLGGKWSSVRESWRP